MARLFGTDDVVQLLKLFPLSELDPKQRFRSEAVIRSLCQTAYLGNETLLCRVLGRYKMYVDTTDVGLSSHLMLDGYWEMWLTEALAAIVKPGMTVCDIGANLGYFTLLMADLVGTRGRVHAFEPNPRILSLLRKSVTVNGFGSHVVVHGEALADSDAEVRLFVPENEPKNGHLLPVDGGVGEVMQTRRLDSYAEIVAPDVLKIDADTSEQAIWRGMSGLLKGRRSLTIFLEFAIARYADPGVFLDEILAYGFSLAWLTLAEGIKDVDRATVLAAPPLEDIMLVLRR